MPLLFYNLNIMKIKKVELFHIKIPCIKPFETSFGIIKYRPALIIKLTSDQGLIGYGESSPLDVPMSEPETTLEAIILLKEKLPKLIGLPIEDKFDIVGLCGDSRYPVSLFGIEAAYLDILAKSRGVSLSHLFGATNSKVPAGESVGLQSSIEMTLKKVESYIKKGYSRIKIKIAKDRDIEIIKAVRQAYPSLYLGADANTCYTDEDIEHLAGFVKYNLAFIEQPFEADNYKAHATLKSTGIKICLDETIRDIKTCTRAIEEKACDMINIKPARIGSFKESLKIHDLCVSKRIKLFGGGRLETGIGKSANASFYALPGFTEASDITPPQDYLELDIINPPFRMENGMHRISNLPGIGANIDEKVLKRFTIEHYIFQ